MKRWCPFALALSVGVFAAAAGAVPVPVSFFHSPGDDGSAAVLPLTVSSGEVTLNLWADPTAAKGGATFEVVDVILKATGAVEVVSFGCDSGQGGCLGVARTSSEVQFTAGDSTQGNSTSFPIGTLVLRVTGAGTLDLISGTALDDGGQNVGDIPSQVVVSFAVPEPPTAALSVIGLLGLAWMGRKRRV